MIRHIVLWNYKQEFSQQERKANSEKIKQDIESLRDVVKGVVKIQVVIKPLDSSNVDVILDSLFESQEDLIYYQNHPLHKQVALFIGEVMESRKCIDFEE